MLIFHQKFSMAQMDWIYLRNIVLLLAVFNIKNSVSKLIDEENYNVNGRVVGGAAAPLSEAPYIVSFQKNGIHYCAGSILNSNWIVTAAHCLTSAEQVLSTTLVAGSNAVAGTASTTQKRTISYYVVHDLYIGGTAPYDIGLCYVSTPFQQTSAVKFIALPTGTAQPQGSATLYGWGSTSTSNIASYPTQLQVAYNLPIITLDSCEKALGAKGKDVHNTNLCTGPLTGNVGICTSDSGGPLIQLSNKNVPTLIGIVSWGKLPCGQVNSPSVYVSVMSFLKWIKDNQVVTL